MKFGKAETTITRSEDKLANCAFRQIEITLTQQNPAIQFMLSYMNGRYIIVLIVHLQVKIYEQNEIYIEIQICQRVVVFSISNFI